MTAIPIPIRLDRVQTGLFEAIGEAIDPAQCLWSYGEESFESLPDEGIVALTMIGGPQPNIRTHTHPRLIIPADDITITVASVAVGKRYGLILNDFLYFTDAIGGDTVTTIRDRLRVAVNADTVEPVTVTDSGADGLLLTADFLGAMRSLQLVGLLTAGAPTLNDQAVLLTEGAQVMLVNVQAFSKGREPSDGAWALMAQVDAALQSEDLVQLLRSFGIGLWDKGIKTDLSIIAGAHWSSRVSFDLTIAAQAAWVRPVERIETVDLTVNTFAVDNTLIESTTVSVVSP